MEPVKQEIVFFSPFYDIDEFFSPSMSYLGDSEHLKHMFQVLSNVSSLNCFLLCHCQAGVANRKKRQMKL